MDDDSFEEIDALVTHRNLILKYRIPFYGDGVVTGYGKVNHRMIYVFAQDFTVFGGSLSEPMPENL